MLDVYISPSLILILHNYTSNTHQSLPQTNNYSNYPLEKVSEEMVATIHTQYIGSS